MLKVNGRLVLWTMCTFFQQRYSHNPMSLFRIIRHCLGTEMKLVQQVENVSDWMFEIYHMVSLKTYLGNRFHLKEYHILNQ
jgi:hypothetical protein